MRLQKKSFQFLTWGLIVGFLLAGCGQSAPAKVLQVGDKAEDFSLQDSSGHFMKLSDIQPGWYLVLFFYRGAYCWICMNHLIDFKKGFQQFTDAHAAFAAVSTDTVEDSATFNGQWRFPFPLLSDTEFKLIDAYGLRDPKGGHEGQDISHVAVVIIDPQRIVRYKYIGKEPKDRPSNDDILYDIQQLQAGKMIP